MNPIEVEMKANAEWTLDFVVGSSYLASELNLTLKIIFTDQGLT